MSLGAIYNNASYALARQTQLLARLQEQTSSGLRILRASDSPAETARILELRATDTDLQGYQANLDRVELDMQQSSSLLDQVSSSLVKAQELTTQAASSVYGQDDRGGISEQIDSLLEQVVMLANTKQMGRYLLGGSNATVAPYSVQRTDGKITSVQYQGGLDAPAVPVAPGVEMPGLLVGDQLFRNSVRQAPTFLGSTGAQPGTATPSVRGDAWLTVSHVATTVGGASGVAAGASSAAGDTILGAHQLVIDATARTASLDGGQPVAFTNEQDLRLTNSAGEVAYLDMHNWNGAGGTFSLSSSGSLSLDDGPGVAVGSFDQANVKVTNPAGQSLYVDTRQIKRVGTEPVRVPGTYDLFDTLINLRDLLKNSHSLPSEQQNSLLGKALDSVKEVTANLSRNIAATGARLQAVDSLKAGLDNIRTGAKQQADGLQDADTVDIAMQLAKTQNFYQMTLASTAKLLNLSLLDYL